MGGRVSVERLEELLEKAEQLREVAIDFPDGLEPHGRVAERYVGGELAFHAHLGLAAVARDAKPCEFCACFQVATGLEEWVQLDDCDAHWHSHAGLKAARVGQRHIGGMQSVVPVVACHLVEDGKEVRRLLPSVVRLQTLDECGGIRMETDEIFGLRLSFQHHPDKGLSVALASTGADRLTQDREFVVLSRRLVVGLDECPDEMVEDGSPVVETLAHRDREPRRDRVYVMDVARVPAALEIELRRDAYRVSCPEPVELALQILQTFICPIEL